MGPGLRGLSVDAADRDGSQRRWESACGQREAAQAALHTASSIASAIQSAQLQPRSTAPGAGTSSYLIQGLGVDSGQPCAAAAPARYAQHRARCLLCTHRPAGRPGSDCQVCSDCRCGGGQVGAWESTRLQRLTAGACSVACLSSCVCSNQSLHVTLTRWLTFPACSVARPWSNPIKVRGAAWAAQLGLEAQQGGGASRAAPSRQPSPQQAHNGYAILHAAREDLRG